MLHLPASFFATNGTASVLWVDDEPTFAHQLAPLLQSRGYSLHITDDFASARALVGRYPVSLFFINVMLDMESGFQFAEWLRQQASTCQADIVFLNTTHPAALFRDTTLLRYQALEYLDKPITQEQILTLLSRYETGELRAPKTTHSFTPPSTPHPSLQMGADPGQFLMDPDEWADSMLCPEDELEGEPTAGPWNSRNATPTQEPPPVRGRSVHQPPETVVDFRVPADFAAQLTGGLAPKGQPKVTSTQERLWSSDWQQNQHLEQALQSERQTTPGWAPSASSANKDSSPFVPKQPARQSRSQRVIQRTKNRIQPRSARSWFDEGKHALECHRLGLALNAFQRAMATEHQALYQAYYGWTLFMMADEKPEYIPAAEQQMLSAVEFESTCEQAVLCLGRFYQHRGKPERALRLYQRILGLHPQLAEVYRESRLLELKSTR